MHKGLMDKDKKMISAALLAALGVVPAKSATPTNLKDRDKTFDNPISTIDLRDNASSITGSARFESSSGLIEDSASEKKRFHSKLREPSSGDEEISSSGVDIPRRLVRAKAYLSVRLSCRRST